MLIHNLKPIPNIITKSQNPVNLLSATFLQFYTIPRVEENHPKKGEFKATDDVNSMHDITDKNVKELGQDFKTIW